MTDKSRPPIWDRDLSEKALAAFVMITVFCVLTWFNASDFDWELRGEGGTVTIATLAAVGWVLKNFVQKAFGVDHTTALRKQILTMEEQMKAWDKERDQE
jgi:hypothetical protein